MLGGNQNKFMKNKKGKTWTDKSHKLGQKVTHFFWMSVAAPGLIEVHPQSTLWLAAPSVIHISGKSK
jgi:hypothetical protein